MKHGIALPALCLMVLTALSTPRGFAQNDAVVGTVTRGNTEFAVDLYQKIKPVKGNLFFSPYSISTAMAMTYAGAREETAKQMAAVLHFTLAEEELHCGFAEIRARLNAIQKNSKIQLTTANSLWPQKKYPFLKGYLKLARKYYQTEIEPVDYSRNPEDARARINTWVERETNNRIKNIISRAPSPLTRLVLVNAIYFKGDWDKRFGKSATTESPFYLDGGQAIEVPMMNQRNEFKYAEQESSQVLELPYAGKKLAMLVLLPKRKDGLRSLEQTLTKDGLEGLTGNLANRNVEVSLPRFKLESAFRIDQELQAMGMKDAFDMDKANFAGMDGIPNWLYIGAVLHKAFIDVNEEGTEAAAATGVEMGVKSAPTYDLFRADHPFLFLIRDDSTGSILFMGRVSNPSIE